MLPPADKPAPRNDDAYEKGIPLELTERELLLLVITSLVVFVVTLSFLGGWWHSVLHYGDNAAYAEVATAIQRWNFHGLNIQHFMGYPYAIAAVSSVSRLSIPVALWLVACISSVVAVVLTARLYGTRVAAYFALSNFAWLQLSFLGGSEPLGVALAMGSLLAFRQRRPFLAAVLAALGVTVRPLILCALLGIGLTLLQRKQFRSFLIALATSLCIGGFYVAPLAIYFGDPLLTVHSYTSRDYGGGGVAGPHGHLFGWPFHGIIVGTLTYPAPWTNLVLSCSWILLVLVGTGMMFSKRFRDHIRAFPNEGIYCGLYLLVLFCYDYLIWARGSFIRFSIPVLPLVFYALLQWLPKSRWFLWFLAVLSPILAAASAVGIRNVKFH